MELVNACAVVLRCTKFGENDKYLTIMDERLGKVSVCARGSRSFKNRNAALCQPFCYCELLLRRFGDNYYLDSGQMLEGFYNLRQRPKAYAYAAYFSELLINAVCFGDNCERLLKVLLNIYHFMCDDTVPLPSLRLLFEMQLLSECGYAPHFLSCVNCGNDQALSYFNTTCGGAVCAECAQDDKPLDEAVCRILTLVQTDDLKIAFTAAKQLPLPDKAQEVCTAFVNAHFPFNSRALSMLELF